MEKLQAKNVNRRESIPITAKIISRKYNYRVLLCKSARLVRKKLKHFSIIPLSDILLLMALVIRDMTDLF